MEEFKYSLTHTKRLVPPRDVVFTAREKEVLILLTLGLTHDEIAEKLYIARPTVKTHILRMRNKTGTVNGMELVVYALFTKLINTALIHKVIYDRLRAQTREAAHDNA